jgi:hypothetical protein
MKLGLVLCLTVMLLVTINIVSVHAQYGYHPNDNSSLSLDLAQEHESKLIEQVTQLQQQHNQDFLIIFLLIAIIAGLGSGIIALTIIFLKNRNLKIKPNPDS